MGPSERQEEAGHRQFALYGITQALLDWKIRDPNYIYIYAILATPC